MLPAQTSVQLDGTVLVEWFDSDVNSEEITLYEIQIYESSAMYMFNDIENCIGERPT